MKSEERAKENKSIKKNALVLKIILLLKKYWNKGNSIYLYIYLYIYLFIYLFYPVKDHVGTERVGHQLSVPRWNQACRHHGKENHAPESENRPRPLHLRRVEIMLMMDFIASAFDWRCSLHSAWPVVIGHDEILMIPWNQSTESQPGCRLHDRCAFIQVTMSKEALPVMDQYAQSPSKRIIRRKIRGNQPKPKSLEMD